MCDAFCECPLEGFAEICKPPTDKAADGYAVKSVDGLRYHVKYLLITKLVTIGDKKMPGLDGCQWNLTHPFSDAISNADFQY